MYYQLCITRVMYPTYYQYVIKVRLLNMSACCPTKLTNVRKQNKMVFPKPSCTGTKKKTLSILREARRGWSHWVQKVCVWLHAECMSHATVANNHWTGLFECTTGMDTGLTFFALKIIFVACNKVFLLVHKSIRNKTFSHILSFLTETGDDWSKVGCADVVSLVRKSRYRP